MNHQALCMNLNPHCGIPFADQIPLLRDAGFDGFFNVWSPEADIAGLRRAADRAGMLYQSIHGPFMNVDQLWYETEQTPRWMGELLQCVRDCADNGVPIMVSHAFIGFEYRTLTPAGFDNFGAVIREAERLGVKIAFENTEGEDYLEALMTHFADSPAVGFCWDSGHALCYNFPRDPLARYGKKLLCTHLNDNLGIREPAITPRDDLHLLPFDGIGDWETIVRCLNGLNYNGPLTFEFKTVIPSGGPDLRGYRSMAFTDYLALAGQRVRRVAALKAALRP